ncbi:MAG TPA: YciI family protein [Dehalococcoidia bacterium]|nr:YciI family protein [Dehalococcoidia bacterium]
MRFMVIVKGNQQTEAGVMPTESELAEMGAFNEELVKAGKMLAGEGLHPTSKGVKIRYDGDKRTVIDGPFTEAKEIVAGFWIFDFSSKEEAIEWMKKAPFREGEVEIRQIFEADDFGEALTPELREQEERLRAEVERRLGKR